MGPGFNVNSYSSQKGIEEKTLLGTSSESCELKVVLLSLEDSLFCHGMKINADVLWLYVSCHFWDVLGIDGYRRGLSFG